MTDREKFAKMFLRPSSKKNLAHLYILLNVVRPSNTFFPNDLSKQLANTFVKEDGKYFLKGPELSRILGNLKKDGILHNEQEKKNIKRYIVRELKGGEYEKRGGRYSLYKPTSDVEELLDVLGNQVALEIIQRSLKNSGLLMKFFKILFMNVIHILSKADENTLTSIAQGFSTMRPVRPVDWKLDYFTLQRFPAMVKKIDKTKLECLASETANKMMTENTLLNALYLLFALPTKL